MRSQNLRIGKKFKQSEKYTLDHVCWECGEVIIICTAYPAEIVALDYLNVLIDKGTRDYEIKSEIYMNDIYLTTIIKNIYGQLMYLMLQIP